MEGVISTTVGYTGGGKENPTYRSMGDHSESVLVEYDPARVSYEELLEVFWSSHDPGSKAWSRQYRNALFYHNEEQKRLALESKKRIAEEYGITVETDVEPAGTFYPAENYHQKYALKNSKMFLAELRAFYPDDEKLTASTAAARINGYLGGYGSVKTFMKEVDLLGLTAEAKKQLLAIIGR